MVYFSGSLKLAVLEARDLRPTDFATRHQMNKNITQIDPYISIDIDDVPIARTTSKSKTNRPVWNENFQTEVHNGQIIGLTVFHDAAIPPDEFVANVFLPLEEFKTNPDSWASFHYQNNGPFHGGDPCSISNFNMASNLIKSTISVAKSRSCWLDVHRLLILKYLIAQFSPNQVAHESKGEKMKRVNCTCACWRMLHSAAAQLEYVVQRLQVLHCLMAILADQCPDVKLNDWMKLFHHKQTATSDNNLRMASFCVNTILQTTESLYQKLKSVLTSDMVMIGKTLTCVILSKVNSVLEQDPKRSFYFPKQDEKAMECVKEIMLMLQAIQDTLSEDAHNVNEMDQGQEELSEVWNSHILVGANKP